MRDEVPRTLLLKVQNKRFIKNSCMKWKHTTKKKKRLFTRVKTLEISIKNVQKMLFQRSRKASMERPSENMFQQPSQPSKKVYSFYRGS